MLERFQSHEKSTAQRNCKAESSTMRICVCAYVWRVSYHFWVKKCEITPQHNKNNRQVIHYYFPFLPCISEQQLTYVSLPAIVRGSGNVRTVVPLFLILGHVLIYILNSQHACIPSTWLCSLVSPLCLSDRILVRAPIQGSIF